MKIEGFSIIENENGERTLGYSQASKSTQELLAAMLTTDEGTSNAFSLVETNTQVTLEVTDELLFVDNGDGSFSVANAYMLPSDNSSTPESATLIVSKANLDVEGSTTRSIENKDDVNNAQVISFKDEYDTGSLSGNNGLVATSNIVNPSNSASSIYVGFNNIPLPRTGTLQGELNAYTTHEARHLTKENYNIRRRKGGRAGEKDALMTESKTRIQYLNK